MINPFAEINWHPDIAERRSFARSWVFGFPMLAAVCALVSRWKHGAWPVWALWLAVIGGGLGALLWIAPLLARPFYTVWHFVGCCVGFVVGNAVFIAVYYLVVTPVGLLLRALGRDAMQREFDRAAPTYWQPVKKNVDAASYFRQF